MPIAADAKGRSLSPGGAPDAFDPIVTDADARDAALLQGAASPPSGSICKRAALLAVAAFAVAGLLAAAAARVTSRARASLSAGVTDRVSKQPAGVEFWKGVGCENWEDMLISEQMEQSRDSCHEACRGNDLCYSYGHYESSGSQCSGSGRCMLFGGFCQEQKDDCWGLAYIFRSARAFELKPRATCSNWNELLVDKSPKASSEQCEEWCHRYPLGCSGFNFNIGAIGYSGHGACFLFRGPCVVEQTPDWDLNLLPADVDSPLPPPANAKAGRCRAVSRPRKSPQQAPEAVKETLNQSNAVELEWYDFGRTGNQLIQVMTAIVFAQGTGRQFVCFPDSNSKGDLRGLFLIPFRPACMPVLASRNSTSILCTSSDDPPRSGIFFEPVERVASRYNPDDKDIPRRCEFSLSDGRNALQHHLLPLGNPGVQVDCQRAAEFMDKFSGLTIHLRSGDLLNATDHIQAAFAPCAFFDFVIDRLAFKEVLIVTEPDRQHPCIQHLQDRGDIAVTVQSRSVRYDACTLTHAKHLALGSFSTFSVGFGLLMNNALSTLHNPFPSLGEVDGMFGSGEPCTSEGQGRIQFYNVDGLSLTQVPLDQSKDDKTKSAELAQKLDYIRNTGLLAVRLAEELCFS